jgi:hypothetical protein
MHLRSRGLHRHPSARVGRRISELHEAAQSTSEQKALPSALPSPKPDIDRQRHAVTTIRTAMPPFAREPRQRPCREAVGQPDKRRPDLCNDPGETSAASPKNTTAVARITRVRGPAPCCHLRFHLCQRGYPGQDHGHGDARISGGTGRVATLRIAATSMDNITLSDGEVRGEKRAVPPNAHVPSRLDAIRSTPNGLICGLRAG